MNRNTRRVSKARRKAGLVKTGKGNPVNSSLNRRISGKRPWKGAKPAPSYFGYMEVNK